MNDSLKTILFILAALLMVMTATSVYYQSQPMPIDDFQLVGQPFYDQFDDAQAAHSLEVTAIDPESATVQRFKVEQENGLWTIPSHHHYPAEAADRLASTATAVMGLVRESLVGRTKGDHERLGVMDPLDEETLDPESAGKRISIKDGSGDVLVDLIVGHQAGDTPPDPLGAFDETQVGQNYYYVRRPDENQTYKVLLEIDLSTRFSDWIRPDLLQISPGEVRQISIDNYEMKEERTNPLAAPQLYKMQGEQLKLDREGEANPWSLTGLDDETETLDDARVNQLVSGLDELSIVGVRPKTLFDGLPVLTPDLKLNPEVVQRFKANTQQLQNLINQVQFELKDYGFNLAPGAKGPDELMLVSDTGEMSLGTDKGVVYALQFGKPVTGEETSIEIGGANNADEPSAPGRATEPQETAGNDADPPGAADTPSPPIKNRFLMIRVNFDETLLTGKPVKPTPPVAPTPPPGYQPERTGAKDGESTNAQAGESGQDGRVSGQETAQREPAFQEYEQQLKNYDEATAAYELGLTRFEDEQAEYAKRVKEGKNRVAALNERYGAWFYVISGNNLETLQVDRKQLVQSATPNPNAPLVPNNPLPTRPNINFSPESVPPGTESTDTDPTGEPTADADEPGRENSSPDEEGGFPTGLR